MKHQKTPKKHHFVEKVKEDYKCNYCNETFTRKTSLDRHLNDRCKIKKDKDDDKEEILKLLLDEMKQYKKTLDELKEQNNRIELENKKLKQLVKNNPTNINSNNTTNNQQNNTIINNFNLVAFGKEELENVVSDDVCKKILFKGFEAIPGLIEYVHFNKDKPEYHNCFISNMRDKYAITFDGKNWNLTDASNVINTLRDDKQIFLENKFEEFYDSLEKTTVIWNLIFLDNIITINKSNKYQDTYSTFTNLLFK